MSVTRNYVTQASTNPYRIAKFGSADGTVVQAAGATDKLIGVFDELAHDSGERADVVRDGRCLIQFGGNVTRGDFLTSDANGNAITAAPAAGSNVSIIGRAEVSGVSGDVVEHVLSIGSLQG
jgi:hypothetical protein